MRDQTPITADSFFTDASEAIYSHLASEFSPDELSLVIADPAKVSASLHDTFMSHLFSAPGTPQRVGVYACLLTHAALHGAAPNA